MPDSDTGERVTPVLDFPFRDGLAVQAVRVDYTPGGFSRMHVAPDVAAGEAGAEVFALTPFDRDGVASDYAVVPAAVLAPKPRTLTHVESAALTLARLSARQRLFEHGALRNGERVRVLCADGGVGHLAVQLADGALAEPNERADLIFDTVGGDALAAAVGCPSRPRGENSTQGGAR
jgi:hypothetical protein